MKRLNWRGWMGLLTAIMLTACGGDDANGDDANGDDGEASPSCEAGEDYNPITGACEAEDVNNTSPNNASPNNTSPNNASPNNASPNNASPNNASPNNTSPNNSGVVVPAGPIDPTCVDGMYMETPPDPSADINAEVSGYQAANYKGFIDAVLAKRYPVGAFLVTGAEGGFIDCVAQFTRDTSSAAAIVRSLSTVVHECGHVYDLDRGGFGDSHYAITQALSFQCSGGDTTSRGGQTFARSRINDDMFAMSRPPCNGSNMPGCDFYADVYLDGDPDDNNFESGDQGFNSVLEETVQYVNSLATGYAFHAELRNTISERDGILTFLWYIGRYLRMARLDYPSAYQHLMSDSCWREAILTVWGRGWLFLELTKDINNLGIDDTQIEALVMDGAILEEIQRVRDAHGCGM